MTHPVAVMPPMIPVSTAAQPLPRLARRLLAISTLLSLVTAGWATALTHQDSLAACAVGALVGNLLGLAYWHPFRVLGFVPPSLTVAFVAAVGAVGWDWHPAIAGTFGTAAGFALGSLTAARGVSAPSTPFAWLVSVGAMSVGLLLFPVAAVEYGWLAREEVRASYTLGAAVAAGAGVLAAWSWLFRPLFELLTEPLLWLMYRIRAAGPGLAHVPARGPCLVIANHACWFDPLFLAKVFPRPVTPMMTSRFYDLPVMRWLMQRVFHTIRVPDKVIKQDAPEIQEAIAALDRGECVVIFPEGYLRRSEDKPLKRFGRGAWHILTARPETPVITCWIEGGWGSYCSYFNGKPTKNKKPDRRRRIGIGVPDPVTVDPATLEHHLRTRLFLMNRVAEARKLLGLPELPLYELPSLAEGKEDEEE